MQKAREVKVQHANMADDIAGAGDVGMASGTAIGDLTTQVPRKVLEYEAFLNERLKVDLKAVLERRDSLYSDIAEYLQLRNVIDRLHKDGTAHANLKAMVDLGCNFYCQARVPDPSRVFVAVGFGFFVEFTHTEALDFIEKKVNSLKQKAEVLTEQASQIKARIRVVVEALGELQFRDTPPPQSHRHIW